MRFVSFWLNLDFDSVKIAWAVFILNPLKFIGIQVVVQQIVSIGFFQSPIWKVLLCVWIIANLWIMTLNALNSVLQKNVIISLIKIQTGIT